MSLSYYPNMGEVLLCNFDEFPIEPEMCKPRPVVVASPRLRARARLVGVVPLSTTPPSQMQEYHCEIALAQLLPAPFDSPKMWAKCDMYAVVSLDRLDRFKEPRARYGGARKWTSGKVTPDQLKTVRRAMLKGLGFD